MMLQQKNDTDHIVSVSCSDKGLESNNIILKEKNELITNSSTLANLFNNYFINITSTLKLKQSPPKFPSIPNLSIHYRDHMSIKK